MKFVGSMQTLMQYARELAQAEKNKEADPDAYLSAKGKHDVHRVVD